MVPFDAQKFLILKSSQIDQHFSLWFVLSVVYKTLSYTLVMKIFSYNFLKT